MSEAKKHGSLTSEQWQALQRLDGCLVANTIETFHQRLRNEGFMDGSIRCLFPHLRPMLGYAGTMLVRGSAPPYAGPIYRDRTDWWNYLQTLPSPRVLVVHDAASRPGFGSLVGAVHMNILRALDAIGVVTNGAVRDIPAAEKAGFHYFAGNAAISHAYIHIVEFGQPVEVGGMRICSGDLLHGDLHGVQGIPLSLAAQLPAAAARIAAEEQAIIDVCRSPDFSLERLRRAVRRKDA